MRVIVLGHIVRGPVGGMAWHHLQYVLGLARLGHDVWFLEDSQDYASCYDPERGVKGVDPTYGLRFARDAFAMIGLSERFAYYDSHTDAWLGPAASLVHEVCAAADLLLNMSGKNRLRPWFTEIPDRVLIDTDPAFTQIRHLLDPAAMANARAHTAFLTFAENVRDGSAELPADGLPWRATRQPIVLDAWPVTAGPPAGKLTTVMLWDSYPARSFAGVSYGMKSASFAPFLDLPRRVDAELELAVGSPSAPKAELRRHGWGVVNPLEVTRTPRDYGEFIRSSKAEFSVAKQGYVVSRSGWFSERSAAYLASGRPVVVQDTGFSSWLETGAGVMAFCGPEDAAMCIRDLDARYGHHCRRARALAEEHFDSDRVLGQLIADACSASATGKPETAG
jgi:hypothetical protein